MRADPRMRLLPQEQPQRALQAWSPEPRASRPLPELRLHRRRRWWQWKSMQAGVDERRAELRRLYPQHDPGPWPDTFDGWVNMIFDLLSPLMWWLVIGLIAVIGARVVALTTDGHTDAAIAYLRMLWSAL